MKIVQIFHAISNEASTISNKHLDAGTKDFLTFPENQNNDQTNSVISWIGNLDVWIWIILGATYTRKVGRGGFDVPDDLCSWFCIETLEDPTYFDWISVKCIFRYLQDTIDFGITYKYHLEHSCMESLSDVDHGGDESLKYWWSGIVAQLEAITTTEAKIVSG
ncbi:hypothetical protein JTB14_028040 [Gonioctena quinquepunctata]|nr:hypothetical protein JTB14_028040 [Gonioctena quinquepunctata]